MNRPQASGRRKHKAFMSKLWEDYERLMSGYPIIGKGIKTPQDRWKATPEEVRHWNSSGHIACELNLCCWYTKLKECYRNCFSMDTEDYERIMRGSWVETHNLQRESEFHRTYKEILRKSLGILRTHTRLHILECLDYIDQNTLINCMWLWL